MVASQQQQSTARMAWSSYVPQLSPPNPPSHSTTSPFAFHLQHYSKHSPSLTHFLPSRTIENPQSRHQPRVCRQTSQGQFITTEQHSQQAHYSWNKPSCKNPPASLFWHSLEDPQAIPGFRCPQHSVPAASRHRTLQVKQEHQQFQPLFFLPANRSMPTTEATSICAHRSATTSLPFASPSSVNSGMGVQDFPMPVSGVSESKQLAKSTDFDDQSNGSATDPDTSDEGDDDGEYDPAATRMLSKASGPKRIMPHRPAEVADKESGKPYAKLVYEALSSAPQCQMAVSEIYDYFRHHYPQFRAMKGRGWMNSIRYNLSMNEGFELVKRPEGDNGKGGLWQLTPAAQKHGIKSTTRSRQTVIPRKRGTSTRCSLRSAGRRMPFQPYDKSTYLSYEDYEERFENDTDDSRASSYDELYEPLTPLTQEPHAPGLHDPEYGSQEIKSQEQGPFFLYQHQLRMHGDAFTGAQDTCDDFHTFWDGSLPSPPIEFYHSEPYQVIPTAVTTFTDSNFEEQLFITRYGFGNASPTREAYA